jgi:large subunit ribosomal protein L29
LRVDEIRVLNSEELVRQLEAAHKELFELRFKVSTRQLVNHREIRRVKKTIARLNTVMRERELNIR